MAYWDTILTLVGWMIAGVVTAVGALLAFWLHQWREDSRRDLIEIYEPVYRIVTSLLGKERSRKHNPEVLCSWDLDSELRPLISSGRLLPTRLADLDRDLRGLVAEAEVCSSKEKLLEEFIKGKLKKEVDLLKTNAPPLSGFLLMAIEDQTFWSLFKQSHEDLEARIELVKKDKKVTGDKQLFETKARELYNNLAILVMPMWVEYQKTMNVLFDHTRGVKSNLSESISKNGKKYEKAKPIQAFASGSAEAKSSSILGLSDDRIQMMILEYSYEEFRKDPHAYIEGEAFAREVGLDPVAVSRCAKYLSDKGLLRIESWMYGGNFIGQITSIGIDFIHKKSPG
jgi:hypothetical protein